MLERLESEGLAHYSYLIGDGAQAVVIDPRRDVQVYIDRATRAGMRITYVLETHRNEDYVVGSLELASRTDATVLHSDEDSLDYGYGDPIRDGETVTVGRLAIRALHTPGHTLGHTSYLLHDPDGEPWVVFTGDALFAGDVGRTDFYGQDQLTEMTGRLYDSLFHTILPLGDGVIVCPAHGAGSACGTAIAERPWTTVGLERKHNPMLQYTERESFVANVGKMLEYPPYFSTMEALNLEGPPLIGAGPYVPPLRPLEFAAQATDAQVVDTRMETGFAAAHVPGALSIPEPRLSSFAGWFLSYDMPVLLVTGRNDLVTPARTLSRMGYDSVSGFLAGGMHSWHTAGLASDRIATVTVQELCDILDAGEEPWILDIRSAAEVERRAIPTAHHLHLTQLPERMDEVAGAECIYVFCGSGVRSMIAASLLRRSGYDGVRVVLGGLAGWSSVTCPLE